ncbi:MAG TPA: decarboxylase [Desulfotomaculum sp.]|nr:decarboxylase [Desulfotomaculum sp.]
MGHNQNTPIIDAVTKYVNDWTVRFHMPGHKGAPVMEGLIGRLIGNRAFAADVTNVPGMDDLHQAQSVIKEAQELAAQTFGADRTYFLVNGSSCGLQALIMAVCGPGDKLLVPRNMHRSILSGIILTGAVPIFYRPEYDSHFAIPLSTSPDTIEYYTSRHPDIKAVVLVNPTYHGIVSDISAISCITRQLNIPLLVDEAHGPHLRFHEELPRPSLDEGADAAVQGTHKMLSALTQASMLHLKGSKVDPDRVESALRLLQSTSTSYLLLSSLDATRSQMSSNGREILQGSLELAFYLRKEIMALEGFSLLEAEREGIFGLDPTKITISLRDLKISGFWSEQWLREKHSIQVEMSDMFNLLLIVTHGNFKVHAVRFLESLRDMKKHREGREDPGPFNNWEEKYFMPEVPKQAITPREAFWTPWSAVTLLEARGRICSETIACYPPGIPIICPGEVITGGIVDYLLLMKNMGAHFQGCQDPLLRTVRVIR